MKWFVSSLTFSSLLSVTLAQNIDQQVREREGLAAGGIDLQLTPTMPDKVQITSNHGAEYNSETGQVIYDGGVKLDTDNGMQLFADKAILDTNKKLIHLQGDVTIYQGTLVRKGEKAVYDYGNDKLSAAGLRTSMDPILFEAGQFDVTEENGKPIYIGSKAGITTHDFKTPNYWLRADKIKIYPDDKVTFKNLKFYVGDTPVFWLPYLSQPLDAELGYHFIPGAKSSWGLSLHNRYGIMLGGELDPATGEREDQWLLSQWILDLRSKRGIGTGVDLFDTRIKKNPNFGWLKLYYTDDLHPSLERSGYDRGFVNEDRYRIEFKHRFDIDTAAPGQTLFDINLTWLSDQYFLEDFEPDKYRINPQPDNTIGIKHLSDYYSLGAFARVQPNDFYQTDTRLPEIYFDQTKRPILGSGLLHESQSSIGYYRENLADVYRDELRDEASNPLTLPARATEIDGMLSRKDFGRLHSYHEFSYPLTPVDGIAITPRAGAGFTHYWSEGEQERSHSRRHLYAGIDAAIKFSKRYPHIRDKRWGIDGLLHVLQPYTSLSVLSTDPLDPGYTRIDRLSPSERPRPYDVGRFSAIDDLNSWSIVRLGARNILITKRDDLNHTWFSMDTYIDTFLNDPESDREFSNLYNDLTWSPLPWMRLGLQTQIPIVKEGFTEVSSVVGFMPTDNLEILLRHDYLTDHPSLRDSSRFDLRTYYRINNKWGVGSYHQWELDDNTLEMQEYSIHRNYDSWTTALAFFHRDNRRQDEYGMMLNFTLQAFPSFNLPFSYFPE